MLCDSSYCRLCAEKNQNGIQLFETQENYINLSELINKYLPVKVSDDEKLPKTICPGCNIQLDSTIQFFDLIISGQVILRTLYRQQIETKRKLNIFLRQNDTIGDEVPPKIKETNFYPNDHEMSLQMEGLDKPRRKRGRPKKKIKSSSPTPEELPQQNVNKVVKGDRRNHDEKSSTPDVGGKRQRKTPLRLKEAVQGKELERMFREEGVIDHGSESDSSQVKEADAAACKDGEKPAHEMKEEVIGLMETKDGKSLGQLIVNKGKGRGRPRGKTSSSKQTCAVCNREFSSLGRYMAHVAIHTDVTYQCTECNEKYTTKLDLINHQEKTSHKGQSIIDWGDKKNKLRSASQNKTPQITNGDEVTEPNPATNSELKESVDPKSSEPVANSSVESLIDNANAPSEPADDTTVKGVTTKEDESQVEFECSTKGCNKVFNSKQSRDVHVKASHLGQRPYACNQCKATFPYQSSLKQHILTHSKRCYRAYACDLCGKVLNHPSSVVYHKIAEHNNGHRFVCIKCGKSFKHRQLLQRHQLVHSDKRPFACNNCNASFKTKANLTNHLPLHSGIKKFKCEICDQQFAHKTSLTLHMRWHSGQKPYECQFCGKTFSQNGNLSEHIRIHTGDKPFVCTTCGRCFTTSSQHRLHVQRHRGERPFKCDDCGKRFLGKESWATHCRRHRGERPHECAVCSRKFSERWALLKHIRSHTGARPYACHICGRTFADCSNLLKHKKIHFDKNTEKTSIVKASEIVSTETAASNEPEAVESDGRVIFYVQQNYNQYQDKDSGAVFELIDPKPVTDQDGNPIQFNMPDGSQVPITSTDGGKTLQITTFDGQVIPVEISGGDFQIQQQIEDDDDSKSVEVQEVQETVGDEQPDRNTIHVVAPDGQTVRLLPTFDDSSFAQYFTIV